MKQYVVASLLLFTTVSMYGVKKKKSAPKKQVMSTPTATAISTAAIAIKFTDQKTATLPVATTSTTAATQQTAVSASQPCGRKDCTNCLGHFMCTKPQSLYARVSDFPTTPCSSCKLPCHLHVCFGCHRFQDPRLKGKHCAACQEVLAESSYCVNPQQGPYYVNDSSSEEQPY